ncbi:hypothetical protein KY329_00945 [Candidatus Woesearchaeota archaeon]|nr:hypothetical protein [Candidatus Woesearchaeota archaeon]
MALADLFKKKRVEEPMPQAQTPLTSEVPIGDVINMQERGLSNNQIIQELQRQGYNPQQIYDALAQAEAKQSIVPSRPEAPEMQPETQSFEEIAEQIVEEKWRDVQKELGKVNEWRDKLNSKVDKMEQSIADLKNDLDGLHKAIVSRVGEYDRTLVDVGTEIKAMEKVFQKVLPDLTSNVQELSRITKAAKK